MKSVINDLLNDIYVQCYLSLIVYRAGFRISEKGFLCIKVCVFGGGGLADCISFFLNSLCK